jgi:hypothetical protein
MALYPQKISTSEAASFLGRHRLIDPKGAETLADALNGAACFAIENDNGKSVFAARLDGGKLWITAAAGSGRAAVFDSLESGIVKLAQAAKADKVGFQTARRGLVKKATNAGYIVTGYILEKAIA